MSNITHILFPTDGSDNSKKALDYVKEIASKFQAKVTILNTYDLSPVFDNYEIHTDTYGLVLEGMHEQSLLLVEQEKKDIEKSCPSVDTLSVQGKAGPSIIDVAEEKKCDMIIIGSRGFGTVKSFLLGSVSNYVLHHSKKPLMIIY